MRNYESGEQKVSGLYWFHETVGEIAFTFILKQNVEHKTIL